MLSSSSGFINVTSDVPFGLINVSLEACVYELNSRTGAAW